MKVYNENEIEEIVSIMKNDGVISLPTDTVYGICGLISSKVAHDKIMKIKSRPIEKLFPIMCKDENQIKEIAIVDSKVEKIIKEFMPGPITLILKSKIKFDDYINNGSNTIAVRMATSKFIYELIDRLGNPIFMSSANKSGNPTCTTIDEIIKECPELDGILNGETKFGKSSTIIDCTSDEIKLLREGPITLENIMKIIK